MNLRLFKKSYFTNGIVIVACLLVLSTPLHSQSTASDDIQKLRDLSDAITQTEQLLQKYPSEDFTANMMFQLGELYLKRSKLRFQRGMLVYEEAERKYDQGMHKSEPTLPRINFSEAIELFYNLLNKFPNVPFRDKLHYRIALCHMEQGRQDEAMLYFETLAIETKDKKLYEESYFRLGEYHFEQNQVPKAIEYYNKLLDSWDSPYFGMSLYKLGWCYYRMDDFSKAISNFLVLIEDINLIDQAAATEILGKSQADLRQESKEYVAICLAEYGGPEKAHEFFGDLKEKAYVQQILWHLADLYQQRNFYDSAIASLQVLLDFYPNKPDAAHFQKKIVENYELAGENPKADQARIELVEKYGPGSKWLQQIPEGETRDAILAIAEEFLYILGSEAQARAQKSRDAFDYQLALNHYESFLNRFPNSKYCAKVQFYVAECFYDLKKYSEAADAYSDVMLNYAESEYKETAAYNRILTYNHLLEKTPTDSIDFSLSRFLDNEDTVHVIKTSNGLQSQLLQASNDFYLYHRDSPRLSEVLMNYGGILYGLADYDLAQPVYEQVILDSEATHFWPQAYSMIAQCKFKQERFVEAEDWFRMVTEFFPDSAKYVDKANKMIASAQFKYAEAFLAYGDSARAAEEFERVAEVSPDSSVAERALFEAALQFENLGNKIKAILIYESLPQKFPESQSIEEALFKAGILCEDLQDWGRAAKNFLALYNLNKESPLASKSLFFAARCYENKRDFENARTYYDLFAKTHRDDPDQSLEAAFKKGEISFSQNQFKTALQDFEAVLKTYAEFTSQKKPVENYFPANAQFLIGEILYQSFDDLKFTPPLRRSLKKKRSAFEKAIKAYTRAAKFKVAEWTTAASHKIGFTFEQFADALWESPRPANLTGSDLDKYDEKLFQSVLPFKEKALEAYRANVKQARENNIENVWVSESKIRIEVLTAELGVKATHASGS